MESVEFFEGPEKLHYQEIQELYQGKRNQF